MLIYNYSRTTFELVGEGVEARLDPVGQNPMIPAFATSVEPPTAGDNQVAVFDQGAQTWSLMDDFRGTVYYNADMVPTTITTIGETVPADCTTEAPPETNPQYYELSGTSWVPKSIEDVRVMKTNEAYMNTAMVMDQNLSIYSKGEMDTWSKMNDECVQFQADGTVGPLMTKKIAVDPIYNTAEALATMTVTEYDTYLTGKYNLEAQRSQHKLNIDSETDVMVLMNYDTSVSL